MTSVSKRKLIIKKNWKKLNRKVKYLNKNLRLTTSDNLIKFHNTATNDVWQF